MDCCGLQELLDDRRFKALAEPNRLLLLTRLANADCACTVGEIAGCCQVDLSVVSRHLKTLREAGVVEAEKHGREVRYRVKRAELANWFRQMADALEGNADSSAA